MSLAAKPCVSWFISLSIFDTTFEDIELLKKEMVDFVRDKENARDFQPDIEISVTSLAEMNKLELRVEIRHKSNWANEAIRASRRSKFMCALVLALRKVPIYGPGAGGAPAGDKANPTYSVSINNEQARQNATIFNDDKDKKRMVPLLNKDAASGTGKSTSVDMLSKSSSGGTVAGEAAAVQGLNKRNLAADPARDEEKREEVLEQKRSNDIEEVRGILRKESITGRRKAANSALSPDSAARLGSRTIPTIPDASPMEPVDAPAAASRVSYFDDSTYKPAPLAPAKPLPTPQQIYPQYNPFPQQTTRAPSGLSAHPPAARVDSATIPPMYQTPSQQPVAPYRPTSPAEKPLPTPRKRSDSLPRKPVPGIGELKGHLLSPK